MFEYLRGILLFITSKVQNIQLTLVITVIMMIVVPARFKFAAELQSNNQERILPIRIETDAGHGRNRK